jgi:hypothetical protein
LAETDDPLLLTDIQLVDQVCTLATVKFDDQAVADFFDQQVDRGLKPSQFARVWIHTHPGKCPEPSFTDEETFERVFGHADWSVMFILACGSQTYARMQFSAGPGGSLKLPVRIDFSVPFAASDEAALETHYIAKVKVDPMDWLKETSDSKIGEQSNESILAAAADPMSLIDRDDPFYYHEDYWYDD